jgi:hypothetical protein
VIHRRVRSNGKWLNRLNVFEEPIRVLRIEMLDHHGRWVFFTTFRVAVNQPSPYGRTHGERLRVEGLNIQKVVARAEAALAAYPSVQRSGVTVPYSHPKETP